MKLNIKTSKWYNIIVYSENYTHGLIEGSKPHTNYPYIYPEALNLKTNDILGSQVGTKNRINKFQSPFNYNLNLTDIKGAKAGSLKKGITTERNTNPINPAYKYIGEQELGKFHINDPYADSLRKGEEKVNENYNEGKSNNVNQKQISSKVEKTKDNKSVLKRDQNQANEKTSEIKDERLEFNKEYFIKPTPNYSYIHDQFIIPINEKNNTKSSFINKTNNLLTKHHNLKQGDFAKTEDHFVRKTYAQKLDSFIEK